MASVAVTFGSIGDILAVIQFAEQLRTALCDVKGAPAEVKLLGSVMNHFILAVGHAGGALLGDDSRFDPATRAAIKSGIEHCADTLLTIQSRVRFYAARFAQRNGLRALRAYLTAIAWKFMGGRKEVEVLRARLADDVAFINMWLAVSQRILLLVQKLPLQIDAGIPDLQLYDKSTGTFYQGFALVPLHALHMYLKPLADILGTNETFLKIPDKPGAHRALRLSGSGILQELEWDFDASFLLWETGNCMPFSESSQHGIMPISIVFACSRAAIPARFERIADTMIEDNAPYRTLIEDLIYMLRKYLPDPAVVKASEVIWESEERRKSPRLWGEGPKWESRLTLQFVVLRAAPMRPEGAITFRPTRIGSSWVHWEQRRRKFHPSHREGAGPAFEVVGNVVFIPHDGHDLRDSKFTLVGDALPQCDLSATSSRRCAIFLAGSAHIASRRGGLRLVMSGSDWQRIRNSRTSTIIRVFDLCPQREPLHLRDPDAHGVTACGRTACRLCRAFHLLVRLLDLSLPGPLRPEVDCLGAVFAAFCVSTNENAMLAEVPHNLEGQPRFCSMLLSCLLDAPWHYTSSVHRTGFGRRVAGCRAAAPRTRCTKMSGARCQLV
ncbi:hypothetical protein AURDEDRAFT_128083 [Auricularia subglabra TFB-10046 SS5]|uniref:Uncharacterized protein n=1 Tax=Auricularia subglabra (strain TFB-10046 / SS5) TaxID=717982 RepID=J0DC96_AURST|nr:hypothetical protein AURDEDRAFT_128083 [Auricularia subglabra TFB-10046 SS5]